MSARDRTPPNARDLLRIAAAAGCPIRNKGGHVIVTIPGDPRPVVFKAPGRREAERCKPVQQIKRFQAAGLI